jgi:hypothetical protein
VLVAHTCNPSYSRGRDQEDHGSKPAQANSLRDPISKKTHHKKRAEEVAQGVGPEFKPQYHTHTHTHTHKTTKKRKSEDMGTFPIRPSCGIIQPDFKDGRLIETESPGQRSHSDYSSLVYPNFSTKPRDSANCLFTFTFSINDVCHPSLPGPPLETPALRNNYLFCILSALASGDRSLVFLAPYCHF